METEKSSDLKSVKVEFETWREQRKGRERIPERLWDSAIRLLDYYPFHKVRKELNLNTKQLKERAEASGRITKQLSNGHKVSQPNAKNPIPKQAFLEVSARDLAKPLPLSNSIEAANTKESTCRIVFERVDGSRLSLNLPVEWKQIQSICQGFLKDRPTI